ncbi:MAG: L,D-transpeptidase, partial [Lentisphaeria bacterium]
DDKSLDDKGVSQEALLEVSAEDGYNPRSKNFVKDLKYVEDGQYKQALVLFNEKKYVASRDLLWEMIEKKSLNDKDDLYWQCAELLSKINTLVIFSNLHTPEKIAHKIVSGDSYDKLSRMYKTTIAAIQKSNNRPVDNFVVQLGRTYNIYAGFWSIKVIKHKFKLILFDQGRVFKVYDISTGKQNRTPVASFKIVTKQKNPDWNPPGQSIKFGEEGNPLGVRWMGMEELSPIQKHFSYGIHGTWQPELIGREASNGCIRMENNDVSELYDIVPYGTEVTIVD